MLALPFRLLPLGRGLGEDELFTAVNFVEVSSLRKTVSDSGAFNNHIGYSLLARTAEALFGRSEKILRLPALLLGLASIAVTFLLCEPFVGTRFALLASLLLAVSPPHIDWSVQARGYSGMILFASLSSYLFFRLLQRASRRDVLLFVIANVAGVYIHLYSVFVVTTQLLMVAYLVLRERVTGRHCINAGSTRLLTMCFAAIAAGSVIVYFPALPSFAHALVGRGRSTFNEGLFWAVLMELSGTGNSITTVVMALAAMAGCVALRRRSSDSLIYVLALFLGPFLLMWFIRPFSLHPARYFVYWLPFYVLLVVSGLSLAWAAGGKRILQRKIVGAIAAIAMLTVVLNWLLTWRNWVADEGYREVSEAAEHNAGPEAVFCAIGGSRTIWRYYIKKPIATPASLEELQQLASAHRELRCLYYEASWQTAAQTQIADFLFQHACWSRYQGHTWFLYKSDELNGKAQKCQPR
jgi:hypothetical protein